MVTIRGHPSSPSVFFCWICIAYLFSFCVVLLCVFLFFVPCCDVCYDFRIKRSSVRLFLQLFIGGLMSYLHGLYLFGHSGVQHILCCVFCFVCLCLMYPILPVSLDCSFLIAPSVSQTFISKFAC